MIDFSFIEQLEGHSCTGYVPDPEGSNSGVTIASGFDIGAHTDADINLAFNKSLADKLRPYTGLKKQSAIQALEECPLELSEEEVSTIIAFSHDNARSRLESAWDNFTQPDDADYPEILPESFTDLPDTCQTVIASVAFQYGYLPSRTPNFWRQVRCGQWELALKNLRNFGDRYGTRRNKEADLLEGWING